MRTRASLLGVVAGVAATLGLGAIPAGAAAATLSTSTCNLPNTQYHHVVYIQFDNQHLSRDNPDVPSDLEQVPALKSFLSGQGTLLSNEHTPLIAHTADDIVTSETGLYPDRQGLAVANSYAQYSPNSGAVPSNFPSAFTYWTDPVSSSDPLPNLITNGQKNAPGPWVPFTRAGCDVGAFSIADIELENTRGDITSVFGNPSPQEKFVTGAASSSLKSADFEGIAIHCSKADSVNGPSNKGICSPQNGGVADKLPAEPGTYTGYDGLFGAAYANQITSKPGSFVASKADANGTAAGVKDLAPPVNDVFNYKFAGCQFCAGGPDGPKTSQELTDGSGDSGFTGFDPTPAQTLGYVSSLQESGIPVTYAYIEDAHNNWNSPFQALGPGQSTYVNQLKEENQAFEAFFERLNHDGINKSNTLFVITADEGDHFAGQPPTNTGCDGVNVACTYAANTIGEQDAEIDDALQKEDGDTVPFAIHFDDAPNFYVANSNPAATSPPGPDDPNVRQLEQDLGTLTLTNQMTGQPEQVTQHLADPEDQTILHMTTTDPLRTPSFTDFADPNFFYLTGGCPSNNAAAGCPTIDNGFAWNHGGDQPEVDRTWLGMVGPTVQKLGQTGSIWTDHTDIRPTMLAILGLRSDYEMDGGAITQVINPSSIPATLRSHLSSYQDLMGAYEQLNAPVGQFGHDSEVVSTTATDSVSGGDAVYQGFNQQLAACQTRRDALASFMKSTLNTAVFGGGGIDDAQTTFLIDHANALIGDMHSLSLMVVPPDQLVCAPSNDQSAQQADQRSGHGHGGDVASAPRFSCLARTRGRRITVDCLRSNDVRATIAVSRGHRVFAYRSGRLAHLVLGSSWRLRSGRYALTIEIAGYKPIRKTLRLR